LDCRNCGDEVDPRRVELGYDYCLKEECQRRCVRRVELAAVGVNKAADYYQRADEVLPPRPAVVATTGTDDDGPTPTASAGGPAPPAAPARGLSPPPARPLSTLDRLRQQERELDRALERSYARFRQGDITAREMDVERDRLIEAFNQLVRSENIRYRSMLRRRPNQRR
jgi:hypothetical protein